MPETAATTATSLFLAHEEALEQAAVKIYQALTQGTELTPAECFVVCVRAAAKFLIQYDRNEWRDMIKHASELLLQYAAFYKQSEGDSAYGQKPLAAPAWRSWLPWRR